jgi:serine/threonine-protein kinase
MATVWLARQRALRRDVAIKRARHKDANQAGQLLQEAIVTGQLEHPNIIPIHALVSDENGPAVVMKRVTGRSWEDLIDERASPDRHLEIVLQVCNACAFAHSRGYLHRDIKPANVMLGDFGEVYLLDWGVARRISDPPSTRLAGTPAYLAPEMAGGVADVRSDVFLLGASLHEALTGLQRHQGDTVMSVIAAALTCTPFDYGGRLPDELAQILNKACAPDPNDRYQSVHELRDALLRYREHRSASALVKTARERQAALVALADAPRASDYPAALALFTEARFAFEQSLQIWPEHPDASEGLMDCMASMIGLELSLDHVDAAAALLEPLPDAYARREPLAELVQQKREEQEARASRVLALEQDRDMEFGASARTRALFALAASVLAMTLALMAHRTLMPDFRPSTLRLSFVGAGVLAVMLAVVFAWRRRGAFNLVNQRIAQVCVGTLTISFFQRVAGHLGHAEAHSVLLTDAFLLAGGGLALSAFHRAGPWLASMSLAVAFGGALYPDWIDELFIGLSVFVPVSVLLFGRSRRPVSSS